MRAATEPGSKCDLRQPRSGIAVSLDRVRASGEVFGGDGVQTFGVGRPCTGRAALGAEGEAW